MRTVLLREAEHLSFALQAAVTLVTEGMHATAARQLRRKSSRTPEPDSLRASLESAAAWNHAADIVTMPAADTLPPWAIAVRALEQCLKTIS